MARILGNTLGFVQVAAGWKPDETGRASTLGLYVARRVTCDA